MDPGPVVQDRDRYFADLRRRLAFRFVTRVAASPDDLFAVDFVAFFGVIFFSATWFTSPSSSRPLRAHEHSHRPPGGTRAVCRASREHR
jgi:hypothetical protein